MKYIVDFKPLIIEEIDYDYLASIEEKIEKKLSVSNDEINYFLDVLSYIARSKVNENLDNFLYKCDLFQSMLTHYFENIHCDVNPCMTQNVITNDIVGHSFLVIKILVNNIEQLFLIDPSYIQFFDYDKCNVNKYFLSPKDKRYVLLTPDPGYFIKSNDMEKVSFLLNHGYTILTKDIAKIYGDSFLNTKRGFRDINVFQSFQGDVYINSFLWGNEVLSKDEEELQQLGLLLPSFRDEIEEKKK